MALPFTSQQRGDFCPIMKYNARTARITRKDGSGESATEQDITDGFKAIFDFPTIGVGWMAFVGGKPDFLLVSLAEFERNGYPASPGPDYKQCFRVRVKLSKE